MAEVAVELHVFPVGLQKGTDYLLYFKLATVLLREMLGTWLLLENVGEVLIKLNI